MREMKVCSVALIIWMAVCHLAIAQNSLKSADYSKWEDELGRQKASFTKIDDVLGSMAYLGGITVYEGLPHQSWDKGLLQTELQKRTHFKDNGFDFYKSQRKISSMDSLALKQLLSVKKCFRKYSGSKWCGGYHPDFMVRFEHRKETVIIQLCFGCGEARIYHGDSAVYCDLEKESSILLHAILEDYHIDRPDKKKYVLDLISHVRESDMFPFLLSAGVSKDWKFSLYLLRKEGLLEVVFSSEKDSEKVIFEWDEKLSQWFIVDRKASGALKPNTLENASKLRLAIKI